MNTARLLTVLFLLAAPSIAGGESTAVDSRVLAVVRGETLVVRPDPRDLEPRVANRWQRFAERLGGGRSASRHWRSVRHLDGTRSECRDGMLINECIHSGGLPIGGMR